MKKVESKLEDELRPEYDLQSLQIRKLGPGRKSFGDVIRLEPELQMRFRMQRQLIKHCDSLSELRKRIKACFDPRRAMPNKALQLTAR
jgi:hypothetical protein